MLQVRHLTMTHTKDLRTLAEDFSFVLNPGDKAAVIGEEGNGKSTLLRSINLLENAAKFAPRGTVLQLSLARSGEKAVVSISNQGETISADEIPLLFERFHKTDKSRSVDKDGVGLGLYIVRTILDQHREKITATSENGVTTFTFTVQLAEDPSTTKTM